MTNQHIIEISSKKLSHPLLRVRLVAGGVMFGQEVIG